MATVEGQIDVLGDSIRRSGGENMAAECRGIGNNVEISTSNPHQARTFRRERPVQCNVGLTDDDHGIGFDDPGLFRGDGSAPVPQPVGVITPDVGDDCHVSVTDIRCVVTSEQTNFHNGNIDGILCEPEKGASREEFEIRGLHSRQWGKSC
ncbi:unannotated protein [freshwater metagenome]|uniref:Unannotated protein n=1 Tax=freshwater metagenome TaxID=449393 RepID=A0A6J5YD71_9ZZZZ